jgi:hypothetical protein
MDEKVCSKEAKLVILKVTTIANKVSKNWELQKLQMAQRVAYLVKCYNIPRELVVNIDQTRIHLFPIRKTWEERNSKNVAMIGQEKKKTNHCGNFMVFNR